MANERVRDAAGRDTDRAYPSLIAPLACARSARIAPWNPPTSSSLADEKACLLAPPQHGGGAISDKRLGSIDELAGGDRRRTGREHTIA